MFFNALEKNNSIAGGSYIEKTNESYFIRGEGKVNSIEDIQNIVVKMILVLQFISKMLHKFNLVMPIVLVLSLEMEKEKRC